MNLDKIIKSQLNNTLESSSFTNLGRHYKGKVRDNYYLDDKIIMITSDRVSAFDCVLGTIPFKGQILTELATFWFDKTKHIVPNHYISSLDSQIMLVNEAIPLPIEVIIRRYITGSLWRDYSSDTKDLYGLAFKADLIQNERFEDPIITPSTKEEYGKHDQPISKTDIIKKGLVTKEVYEQVEQYALQLFEVGEQWADSQGLILVDTKYEFGLIGDKIIVIDEIHTPDSSRYWMKKEYQSRFLKNEKQLMLDKENIRQWLIDRGFSGQGTPPELDDDIRILLSKKYIDLYNILTGKKFVPDIGDTSSRIIQNLKSADYKI